METTNAEPLDPAVTGRSAETQSRCLGNIDCASSFKNEPTVHQQLHGSRKWQGQVTGSQEPSGSVADVTIHGGQQFSGYITKRPAAPSDKMHKRMFCTHNLTCACAGVRIRLFLAQPRTQLLQR